MIASDTRAARREVRRRPQPSWLRARQRDHAASAAEIPTAAQTKSWNGERARGPSRRNRAGNAGRDDREQREQHPGGEIAPNSTRTAPRACRTRRAAQRSAGKARLQKSATAGLAAAQPAPAPSRTFAKPCPPEIPSRRPVKRPGGSSPAHALAGGRAALRPSRRPPDHPDFRIHRAGICRARLFRER